MVPIHGLDPACLEPIIKYDGIPGISAVPVLLHPGIRIPLECNFITLPEDTMTSINDDHAPNHIKAV